MQLLHKNQENFCLPTIFQMGPGKKNRHFWPTFGFPNSTEHTWWLVEKSGRKFFFESCTFSGPKGAEKREFFGRNGFPLWEPTFFEKVRFLDFLKFFWKVRFAGPNARNFPLGASDVFVPFSSPIWGEEKLGCDAQIDFFVFAHRPPKNALFRKNPKRRVATRPKITFWKSKNRNLKIGFRVSGLGSVEFENPKSRSKMSIFFPGPHLKNGLKAKILLIFM